MDGRETARVPGVEKLQEIKSLPKRAAAFGEGHEKSSALFLKICWEEPKKQKTRSCRAQELSRSRAQWKGQGRNKCVKARRSSISGKKTE